MVDTKLLFSSINHNVKVVDIKKRVYNAKVIMFESECDSGYGVASIGLSNGYELKANEIESLEIVG